MRPQQAGGAVCLDERRRIVDSRCDPRTYFSAAAACGRSTPLWVDCVEKVEVEGQDVDTQWVDVPDNALVTEPNKDVGTLVWPIFGYLSPSIRCFLPGTMS
jgi:hypothetical protein